ncbi:hypothetical protein CLOLEP_01205 [[Clostridium] leptum DSM 753]|uniref:Uncharacterized protein n=1 Tax=[Clostridium] leptum DSM 753 TaxID=428125 RepID=A7VRM1_9FIRM|nr:hypothetical protein CLOLEP_01205 [[Clostridium] leptum DSM 753]
MAGPAGIKRQAAVLPGLNLGPAPTEGFCGRKKESMKEAVNGF